MKNRDIEKQLKKDLSVASSSDFSCLMDKCRESDSTIVVRERVLASGGNDTVNKRGYLRYILWGFMLLLLIGALLLIIPSRLEDTKPMSSGYFVVDINPSIKISYDENGTVTEVSALNEDAEVLLVGLDFSGKAPSDVVSIIFEKCIDLGYFSSDRDNNAVLASATTDGGEQDEGMTSKIKELFTKEFSNKKMRGVVITATNDPSLSQKANEHGIDTQKYALIESYLELGGALDESQYSEISISELYSKISDKEKELKSLRLDNTIREKEKAQNELFDALANRVSALLNKLEACIRELENEPSEQRGEKQAPPSPEPPPHSGSQQEMAPPNNAQGKQGKERYEGFSKSLGDYVVELEIAKEASDCARAVDGILSILSNMKEDEENASLVELIDSTISEIQTLYEEFSKNAEELSALKASAEETNSARLDAFKDKPQGEHENVDDWQKEKEDEIASSWYELKKQWDNERKNDLKK